MRLLNVRQDTEEGGTSEGKNSGICEKGNKRRNGTSINLLVRLVTEFLTKYCMVAYEWYCMPMCACIILIVNLPAE